MDYEQYMDKIVEEEDKLCKLDTKFADLTEKYKEIINRIPLIDILKSKGIENISTIEEATKCLLDLLTKDPIKHNEILSILKENEDFNNSSKVLDERNKIKYEYFTQLYKYLDIVIKTRKETFSETYNKRLDYLADKGYLLYYEYLPDILIEKLNEDDLENYIVQKCSYKNFQYLLMEMNNLLEFNDYSNDLERRKSEELKECVSNLIDGRYNSFLRGMFALLENEHYKTSEVVKETSGFERSNKISEIVDKLNIDYFTKEWDKINNFYKSCNKNTKYQQNNEINRNDLDHGQFNRDNTVEDCIKIILLYLCMKDLRYILNNFNLLIEEVKNDMEIEKKIKEITGK